MKVFLDTNVLLDFVCNRAPFEAEAYEIFQYAAKHKIDLVVSALTIINTQYTARKYDYTAEEVNKVINNLLKLVEVSPIDGDMIHAAFMSDDKDKEDILQYLSAQHSHADYIVSRDTKGFVNSPIHTLKPADFLFILQQEV